MHYFVLLEVALDGAIEKMIEGRRVHFSSFSMSLGVRASGMVKALEYSERHVLSGEVGSSGSVVEVEMKEMDPSEIPEEIWGHSLNRPDEDGVYWTSGRIFGSDG